MSGLAVIHHADGRPVDPAALGRMTAAVAHRGPDGQGQWCDGPVGLGHRLLFTTPESLGEVEPAADASGQCRLVWDGRLDNRDELLAATGCGRGSSDPALVLAAYGRWGTGCVERLLGDFAFALWDARERRLLGGRDRIGLKPLHYAWDGTTLLASSEARPLAAGPGGMPEPDDELVLAFLLREFRDGDHARSFFRGVHRLPPGHALIVEGRALRIRRYWAIDPAREIQYPADEEYQERFRELFDEAVRCRLRSYFPVGVFLSGGLDSAAIAATAGRFSGAGDGPKPPVETFTIYSAGRGPDEREWARRVVEAGGLKGHELDAGARAPLEGLAGIAAAESPAVGVGRERDEENMEAIRARGCRVLLTGEGGDQLLDEVGCLADLLYAWRPLEFVRAARAFAGWYGAPARAVAGEAANCLVPGWAKYWGKRVLRGVPPPWINRDLARAVGLRARVRSPRVPLRFRSFAQAQAYAMALNPYNVLKLEVDERYGSAWGMELRYPFYDSRLVEFVLAVPSFRRTRAGERKRLLRAAMRDVVPESVRLRRGKGDWTDSMDAALLALCRTEPPAGLWNASGRMERYLDRRGARALVARYVRGDHDLRWEVWSLVTLDRWLARSWRRP